MKKDKFVYVVVHYKLTNTMRFSRVNFEIFTNQRSADMFMDECRFNGSIAEKQRKKLRYDIQHTKV